jgi:hypothetical protein
MPWRLTYPGVPAPELGWVDRRVWEDEFGRVLEITKLYGSEDFQAVLMSPVGGLLVQRQGRSYLSLLRNVRAESLRRPGGPGRSILMGEEELHLVRTGDPHPRDVTEGDLAVRAVRGQVPAGVPRRPPAQWPHGLGSHPGGQASKS